MLVVDVPGLQDDATHRVSILGSCRVRNPMLALAKAGKVKHVAGNRPASHTSSEALQTTEYFTGKRTVPPHCTAFIFETDNAPHTSLYTQSLIESADTVVVEVCERNLISYRGLFFQSNYFSRQFVQGLGRPVLDWYRDVGRGIVPSEEFVAQVVERLRAANHQVDDDLVDLLRNTKISKETTSQLRANLSALMGDRSKQFIFVSHFVLEDEVGQIMADRSKLRAELAAVAQELGARFFDPSVLIERDGRKIALEADGTDIYEYSRPYNIVIGRALVETIAGCWVGRRAPDCSRNRRSAEQMLSKTPSWNKKLIDAARARSARMGINESGLHAHYDNLVQRGDIVGSRLAVAQIIIETLPRFDHYVILRAGLGELGFVLSETGSEITMFEPNNSRLSAIRDFAEEFGKTASPVSVLPGLVPPENFFAGRKGLDRTLAVAIGFLAPPGTNYEAALFALAKFEFILVEPRNFLYARKTDTEVALALKDLADVGLTWGQQLHPTGFHIFAKSPSTLAGLQSNNRFLSRFESNIRRFADSEYCKMVGGSDNVSVTWSAFADGCRLFQAAFRQAELPQASVVLIFLRHGPDLQASFFGAMASGLVPSFMPPSSPRQDPKIFWASHRELLAQIEPSAVIADSDTLAEMIAAGLDLSRTKIIDTASIRSEFDPATAAELEIIEQSGSAIAMLQHSSGTTGLKKGVALSFDAIVDQLESYAQSLDLRSDDRIASWLPLYHDMGLVACCLLPTYFAIPVIQIDAFEWLAKPEILFDEIDLEKATLCWLPNFAFEHLAVVAGRHASKYKLGHAGAFINCSEVCKASSFDRFVNAFKEAGVCKEQLHCCYAMAEAVFAVSQTAISQPARRIRVKPESLDRGSSVQVVTSDMAGLELLETGRTITGITAKIYDESRLELPTGVVGEIGLNSPFLFSGYNRDPSRTAAQLVGGTYYTRDLGFIHEGDLFVLGRADDLIIINGRNLYAHEIESVLARIDGLKPGRSVAVPLYDARMGSEVLMLICEIRRDTPHLGQDLKRAITTEIVSVFNVAPRRVSLVEEGWLVKTTSGKISRKDNLAKLMNAKEMAQEAISDTR